VSSHWRRARCGPTTAWHTVTAVGSAEEAEELDDWVQGISPRLGHLEAFHLPADLRLDFTRASLDRLGQLAVDRFASPDELVDTDQEGFVAGVVAYVGEALLRVGGGGWVPHGDPLPAVGLAVELGLAPVSPVRLLVDAVASRDAEAFGRAYAEVADTAERHRAENPSWRPVKERTPGVDPFEPEPSDWLAGWLVERRAAFPDWVRTFAGQGSWDFTPDTLDALEALTRRITPSTNDLYDAANHDFVQGAIWYLGEVLRAPKGGDWYFRPGDPDPCTGTVGQPFIKMPGPRGGRTVPILDLEFMLEQPLGYLRQRFERFAS
jgi:hypothetical protein